MKKLKYYRLLFLLTGLLFQYSCGNSSKPAAYEASEETTIKLMAWLDDNGQYINSAGIPYLIDASSINPALGPDILIIDIRNIEEYDAGHIEGAIHLLPSEVLPYLKDDINPKSFEQIVLVCENSMISGHINGLARMLGFDNVVSLRFGMSGWNTETAKDYWLAAVSNKMIDKMETQSNPKLPAGEYPKLKGDTTDIYGLLLQRCLEVGAEDPSLYTITINQLMQSPDKYYIISYWPEDKYIEYGHIKGSVQYDPKKSLTMDTYLNTLPLDKPVVVYCYSGQHSAFVVPYLRVLGYNALNLVYGANSFIHETLRLNEDRPSRTFSPKLIMEYPLLKSGEKAAAGDKAVEKIEKKTVEGGC